MRPTKRSQKLKYHVQTSGRSLHAQEMAFELRSRTTLGGALCHLRQRQQLPHNHAHPQSGHHADG